MSTEKQNPASCQTEVSSRFFVCEDINSLNEIKVISTEFNKWEDADSFRHTMKEGALYKHKSLLIIKVC